MKHEHKNKQEPKANKHQHIHIQMSDDKTTTMKPEHGLKQKHK